MVLLYTVLILLNCCSMLLYLYCCTVAVLLYMVGSSAVDWYADTGTAFHMTDSLSCMKDVKPCHKKEKRDWWRDL